jgi:UMF1 family MFS transporter
MQNLVLSMGFKAGAILLSWLSSKIGNIKSLIVVLCMWILICISAIWVTLPIHFYIIAGAVGLVMGGIQSVSRSTYAKFIPETKDSASYFSYYDVAEKLGIVVGMLSYGIIEQLTGSMRSSIVMLTSFFILALFLLLRVPKEEVNHLHIS